MLVVENKVDSEDAISNQKNFNIDEFIWPHGLTPPLHHVRKRRFRKRVNKRVGSFEKYSYIDTDLIVDDRNR